VNTINSLGNLDPRYTRLTANIAEQTQSSSESKRFLSSVERGTLNHNK
jgi:hypothetical protein